MAKDYLYSVAEIYAQAVYELAQEQSLLDAVTNDLTSISECVSSDDDFAHFLASPSISVKDKTNVLTKIFHGKVEDLTMDFLKVLAARERLETLLYIHKAYKAMIDKAAGRVEGLLTTAVELSDQELTKITDSVSQSLNKTVILKTTVDPAIIGGIQLKIGNISIDGSIRRQLAEMAAKIGKHHVGMTAISEE